MKKVLVTSVIALLVFGGNALAAEKANQGRCVSDCVQAFNKSLSDSGVDAGKVSNFSQKECVDWCKNEYVAGQGYFWQDGTCNQKYAATDPDCPKTPPPPTTTTGGTTLPPPRRRPCPAANRRHGRRHDPASLRRSLFLGLAVPDRLLHLRHRFLPGFLFLPPLK